MVFLARDNKLNAMKEVLVQPMLSGGVEVMVGVTHDPLFAFGLGGIHVAILDDVRFRITPSPTAMRLSWCEKLRAIDCCKATGGILQRMWRRSKRCCCVSPASSKKFLRSANWI